MTNAMKEWTIWIIYIGVHRSDTMSSSYISFNESKIKRFQKETLSKDELANYRIRVTKDFLKGFDPEKETIEVIRREK